MNFAIRSSATALALCCLCAMAWGQQTKPPGKHAETVHKHAPASHPAPGDVMQSGAMRDAMGVARQAFGFAASHPNASEADKQAAADAFMSGIFNRELDGSAKQLPPPTRKPESSKSKDYGDDDD